MWDLSSLTRDRTCISRITRWNLNHWTTREVPHPLLLGALRVSPLHLCSDSGSLLPFLCFTNEDLGQRNLLVVSVEKPDLTFYLSDSKALTSCSLNPPGPKSCEWWECLWGCDLQESHDGHIDASSSSWRMLQLDAKKHLEILLTLRQVFGIKEPVNWHDTCPAGKRLSRLEDRLLKSERNVQFCSCNPQGNCAVAWAEVAEDQEDIKLLLFWIIHRSEAIRVLTCLCHIPQGKHHFPGCFFLSKSWYGPCLCSGLNGDRCL